MDFSNCDPRQAAVDAADCQDEFQIKPTTPPGRYTLMWWWEFNGGEFYNTCADITITAAAAPTPGNPNPVAPSNPGAPIGQQPIVAPPQTCLGLLVGETQTELDLHKQAVARLQAETPPTDPTAYCQEE